MLSKEKYLLMMLSDHFADLRNLTLVASDTGLDTYHDSLIVNLTFLIAILRTLEDEKVIRSPESEALAADIEDEKQVIKSRWMHYVQQRTKGSQ